MTKQKHLFYYLRFIIFFMIGVLALGHAQTHPINNILQEELAQDERKDKNTLPNPLYLTASWWQYFEAANKEDLETRISLFLEYLQSQLTELDAFEDTAIGTQFSHLKANFSAYQALRNRQEQPTPLPYNLKDSYDIVELMNIVHQRREIEVQVSRIKQDIAEQERQSQDLNHLLNNRMADFLKFPGNIRDRVTSALMIIQTQTELALINERLVLQRKNLTTEEDNLTEISKLQDSAVNRLVFTEEEHQDLERKSEKLQAEIREGNTQLLRIQSEAFFNAEDTEEERSALRYYNQRVLKEKINLAFLETRLYIFLNQLASLSLLSYDETLDVERLQKKLSDRQRKIRDISVISQDWVNQNELERINANTTLADLESREDTASQPERLKLAKERLALVQDTSILLQKLQTELADVRFLGSIIEEQLLDYQGPFLNWVNRTKSTLSYGWRNAKKFLRTSFFKVGDTPITPLSFGQFILILVIFWWGAYWLDRLLFYLGNKRGDQKLPVYYIFGRVLYYAGIIFGLFYALTAIGVDFKNFALVAGALVIGLGFGLQSIVNNFVSGLIILFERSIKVGDFIELKDTNYRDTILRGEVKEINVRSTIIATNDRVDIVIPNSDLVSQKINNWTLKEPHRRMRYPFKVPYGVEKDELRRIILEAVDKVPHTLKGIPGRNPAIWLVDFGDSYYHFELAVWLNARSVKRPNSVRAAYMWAIDTALRENDIAIPIPQRELKFLEDYPLSLYKMKEDTVDFDEDRGQIDLFDEDETE